MTDVVLDLETLGTTSDSAVLSIGAVALVEPREDFYVVIDKPSGAVDAGTVLWWLRQHEAVRGAVQSGQPEVSALLLFADWLALRRGEGTLRLWGSEDFDTVILGNAYGRNGMERPWHYQEPRGLRTLFEFRGIDEDAIPWEGTEHIAIDCARHAAVALRLALDGERQS